MGPEIRPCSFDITEMERTTRLGALAAGQIYPGLTVLLLGNLGTGKTEFVRALGNALGTSEVRSPSFILINEYDTEPPLAHADLYRLDEKGAEELGLEEYPLRKWVLLVEWGERWQTPPTEDLWIFRFTALPSERENKPLRRIEASSRGARAFECLEELYRKWEA
ncbi:MAG TPA: tRNA (adenosine(37)-N6)-threonylcarbamoyltransferase complex ATPase subunit type 1 TsaE [Synergistaceae bacterium]|jgi:tRNA threonylcarbamoyladenosine biosynthesis protein TsaE|nr:tRNA (adenosine(37)-N6)-threonylcarbamoyltransferase complex ATPase subunit type 1 TsaE [Synergistaceae bacterium]HPJ25341.1 tRNA (adenosine(37)-N6)-threonylcarbamoyltransferase complex ATPase subunit type 1 TsaE [Synergistaceae bacterium]HPQ36663.1 tRNA (adenosine(37)-N6)-threonylcarbamoyltransferase complex ATPase subunit type 1 TsaE [Synergistaceae bacterium]